MINLHDKARLLAPEVPWDDLDPGIVEVVETFVNAGFDTIASCQGHAEDDAWVTLLPIEGKGDAISQAAEIESLLRLHGWDRYCILSIERQVGTDRPLVWFKVRWWGAVPYR